jgi:hypothetical protein
MERRAWYKERHQARVAGAKQDKRQIKSTKQCFCFLWKGKTEQDRTGQNRTETEQQLHRNPNRRIKTKQLTTTKTTKPSSSFLPSFLLFSVFFVC